MYIFIYILYFYFFCLQPWPMAASSGGALRRAAMHEREAAAEFSEIAEPSRGRKTSLGAHSMPLFNLLSS